MKIVSRRNVSAIALVAVVVLFIATGVWTVRQDEEGIVLRFGRVARVVQPGIQFTLPWPVESLERVNVREVREISVGYRRSEDDPTRTRNEAEWLTGDTNILDIRLIVTYRVADAVKNLTRYEGDESRYLLRKCAESVLTERVAGMGVDELLAGGSNEIRRAVSDRVARLMERLETGIEIESVNVESIRPPLTVDQSFKEIQSALNEVENDRYRADSAVRRLRQKALSDAESEISRANSYRKDIVSEAQGKADAFRQLVAAYKRSPETVRTRLVREWRARVYANSPTINLGKGEDEPSLRVLTK